MVLMPPLISLDTACRISAACAAALMRGRRKWSRRCGVTNSAEIFGGRSSTTPKPRSRSYLGFRGAQPSELKLHVELEQQHVAVFDDVFLAFHPVEAFFARGGDGTAFHQIFVGHGFGLDETAFEIGVNHAGGFWRSVANVNGPGTHFFFAGREIGSQTEQMIRRTD